MTKEATWFHCQAKPISRGSGRQAVAAASYRLGLCLHDEKYDLVHDYRRRGGVVTGFTLAPEGAPSWATDPAQLWNAVEAKENRKNSQLALEWEVALPNELDDPQREVIARRFSQWLVDQYGVAVSTGIHSDGQRSNGPNDHMHVMMTTRPIDAAGWTKNKLRDFNCRPGADSPAVINVRMQMATFINEALEAAGSDDRVTHLSYEARGIDRTPTEHLGPSASEMERREPGSSDRGERNRGISEYNDLVAELAALDAEIAATEEERLDARYGLAEPGEDAAKAEPASPFDAALQPAIDGFDTFFEPENKSPAAATPELPPPRSFDAAILAAGNAIARRPEPAEALAEASEQTPGDTATSPFDTAIRPAVASLGSAGEASIGEARRWKRMLELYRHGTARIAEVGRETLGSWQRFVRRNPGRSQDGPER
jgi:hypothetical protein